MSYKKYYRRIEQQNSEIDNNSVPPGEERKSVEGTNEPNKIANDED